MQRNTSLISLNGTGILQGEYQHITEDRPTETGTPLTSEKSSLDGIAQQIKAGSLTPETAIELAESEWAKKQGRKFVLPSKEAREEAYNRSCTEREMFERNRQPFIFPGFTPEGDFWLSQGLTLVGAMSGKGKSTAAANILSGIIDYRTDTTALVLSNEEATDSIVHRTACVQLKKPYMKFHSGGMFPKEDAEVRSYARTLLPRLAIVNDPAWDSSCLEDVQTILEGAAAQGVNLILIDYLQTVTHSRDFPDLETFQVLKKFGSFIRDYGRRAPVPVVVLCQLNPKSSAAEFQARVQNDKTIYNDAFNAIEIAPNEDSGLTDFIIHKQRFGASQGVKVALAFNSGRYEALKGGL